MTRRTEAQCLLLAACILACHVAITIASSVHLHPLDVTEKMSSHNSKVASTPFPFGNWTTVDVTEYGVVGDGKTDNSKAVQTALAAMLSAAGSANGGGASLYFPPGSYLLNSFMGIDSSILPCALGEDFIPLNFSIIGKDAQNTFLLWNHTYDFLSIDTSNCWAAQIEILDVSIEAISDECASSTTSPRAIYNQWQSPGGGRVLSVYVNVARVNVYPSGGCAFVANGFNLKGWNVVDQCSLTQIAHVGIVGVDTVTNTVVTGIASPADLQSAAILYASTVTNCTLAGFAFGIRVAGPERGPSVNLMATNVSISQVSQAGIWAQLNVGLFVSGCHFNGTDSPSSTAISTVTGTMEGTSGDYEITNSWFNNWAQAIDLTASDGSSVYGCYFESNGMSINAMFPSDSDASIYVQNNTFVNSCTLNLDAVYTLTNNNCVGNQTQSTFWCLAGTCAVHDNDSCTNFPSPSSAKYHDIAQE